MNELKFRAWSINFHKYFEVESIFFNDNLVHLKYYDEDREENTYIEEFISDCIIEQYTGFVDAKNIYIFVGDVLEITYEVGNKEIVPIRTLFASFLFNSDFVLSYKIIGNIHEDRELL